MNDDLFIYFMHFCLVCFVTCETTDVCRFLHDTFLNRMMYTHINDVCILSYLYLQTAIGFCNRLDENKSVFLKCTRGKSSWHLSF